MSPDGMKTVVRGLVVLLIAMTGTSAFAQTLPPVRPLGPVLATSTEPFAAISQVRSLPGGGVIVNDNTGRRVVLFDSAFRTFTVIAGFGPGGVVTA
jgi:hypothetical protein